MNKALDEAIENSALKARVAELEKQLAERDAADKAAVEKAAAADNELTETIERINKRMSDLEEQAEMAELKKVAAKYELLGENVDDLAKVLKSVKGTPAYDTLIKKLDDVLAVVKKSGVFTEVGKNGFGSSAVDINKIAAEIQKSEPQLSWRQAVDKAYQAHPELMEL